MKASKEIKQWINNERSARGKKNGVVRLLWEDWRMELKDENSKKNYKRDKKVNVDATY